MKSLFLRRVQSDTPQYCMCCSSAPEFQVTPYATSHWPPSSAPPKKNDIHTHSNPHSSAVICLALSAYSNGAFCGEGEKG